MFSFATIRFFTGMNLMSTTEPRTVFQFGLPATFTVRLNIIGLFHIDCVCVGYYTILRRNCYNLDVI